MRLSISKKIAQWAGLLSRALLGKSGETLPGKILLTLYPKALTVLSQGRSIIVVSGTNGKTSTTKALTQIISQLGPTVSNKTGSNLDRGCVSALMTPSKYAVLEVDELYLPSIIAATNPALVLLLNLSRDQLHRMHEVKRVAARWAAAVNAAPQTTFVADVDDPFLQFAIMKAHKHISVSFGGRKHPDAAACPSCGLYLQWIDTTYSCSCGLSNTNVDVVLSNGSASYRNSELANIAGEIVGATRIPIDAKELDRSFIKIVAEVRCSIRLVKNPASWSEALQSINGSNVILILNARQVDGIDTSWIWDVSFDTLKGKNITVTGERAIDLAYRLHVAGIENVIATDFESAVHRYASSNSVEVLAAYTAFFSLATQ